VAGSFRDEQRDARHLTGIAEADSTEVAGELLAARLARQPRVSGEEPADQDLEVLDVSLEIPSKPDPSGQAAPGKPTTAPGEQSRSIELSRACRSGEERLLWRLGTMTDGAPEGSATRNRRARPATPRTSARSVTPLAYLQGDLASDRLVGRWFAAWRIHPW